jgi:hypothetical protein
MLEAKWLELFKLLDLGPIGPIAFPVLIIIAVVSTAMAIVGIINFVLTPFFNIKRQSKLELRRSLRQKEQNEKRVKQEQSIISRLDYLSKEEITVVVNALQRGSPTFYTYVHSPPVGMLQGKMMVWTTGGSHHQDHYPFSFHDFVWEALIERKDVFLAKDAENKRNEEQRKTAEIHGHRR